MSDEKMNKKDFCDNNGNCMGMLENKMYTECKYFTAWFTCESVCTHFLYSEDINRMTCNRLEKLEGKL